MGYRFTKWFLITSVVGMVWGCGNHMMQINARHTPALKTLHRGDAAIQATPDAGVTVMTFLSLTDKSDKERFNWVTNAVKDTSQNIRWVFKHRVSRSSSNSKKVAMAAIAAQNQGKFWEFAQSVIADNGALDDGKLFEFAQAAQLDIKQFERDLGDPVTKARVDADLGYALKLQLPKQGVVLFNGIPYAETDSTTLNAVLTAELAKAKRLGSLGIPAAFVSPLLTDLNRTTATGSSQPRKETRNKENSTSSYPVSYSNAHLALGVPEQDALVTMVVFHDYQCAYSRKHAKTVDSLLKAFPTQLRVIVRHNALKKHTHAKNAAAAAVAAAELGIGEVFHRALLQRPNELHRGGLLQLAAELGADPTLIEIGMERHLSLIEKDVQDASNASAKGTPYSFINGRKIRGAVGRSVFLKTIQEELRRAQIEQGKSGLKGRSLYDELIGIPATGGKTIP